MNHSVLKIWLFVFVITAVAYGSYKGYQVMNNDEHDKSADGKPKIITLDPDVIVLDELKGKTLLDRYDNVFHFDDLKGKIWVVNMFFTTCPGPCSALMRQVEQLQNDPDLKEAQFISVTSRPEDDNSKKLIEYSGNFHVNKGQWYFLNGTRKTTNELSEIIFQEFSGDYEKHRERLFLFNREGKIVGAYLYKNPLEMNNLRREIIKLLKINSLPKTKKEDSTKVTPQAKSPSKKPMAPEPTGNIQ